MTQSLTVTALRTWSSAFLWLYSSTQWPHTPYIPHKNHVIKYRISLLCLDFLLNRSVHPTSYLTSWSSQTQQKLNTVSSSSISLRSTSGPAAVVSHFSHTLPSLETPSYGLYFPEFTPICSLLSNTSLVQATTIFSQLQWPPNSFPCSSLRLPSIHFSQADRLVTIKGNSGTAGEATTWDTQIPYQSASSTPSYCFWSSSLLMVPRTWVPATHMGDSDGVAGFFLSCCLSNKIIIIKFWKNNFSYFF